MANNFFYITCLIFALKIYCMQPEFIDNKHKDFAHNWVTSSRFLFLCQIFLFAAFILGGCYGMYTHRYKGKPVVAVPESTLYNPVYK